MQRFVHRLGVVPVLILSIGLFLLGALAIDRVVNTLWLFDVTRIDLARAVVQQRADAPTLLAAANGEILVAFLASIVVAFTGLRVVKHGNRAASSSSGSADVLEALGVSLTLAPEQVAAVAQEAGITFCFANAFHPSMRHAAVARRDLGVGTAFNALGPLTNPGQPTYAAVGVADARIAPLIAGVFAGRGRAAAVFRGDDGLDELTLATTSTVWWVRDGDVTELSLDPSDLGLELSPVEALRGGDAAHNAQVVRDLLAGEVGPVRDAVVLNAGMALATASGLGDDVSSAALTRAVDEGMRRARAAIDDGSAARLLERWVSATAAA